MVLDVEQSRDFRRAEFVCASLGGHLRCCNCRRRATEGFCAAMTGGFCLAAASTAIPESAMTFAQDPWAERTDGFSLCAARFCPCVGELPGIGDPEAIGQRCIDRPEYDVAGKDSVIFFPGSRSCFDRRSCDPDQREASSQKAMNLFPRCRHPVKSCCPRTSDRNSPGRLMPPPRMTAEKSSQFRS